MTKVPLDIEGLATHTSAYGCPQPECAVRYTVSNGYFLCGSQEQIELDMTPRVTCPRDGRPMYLAETRAEKSAFRLWRCPQCDARHTNEENLVTGIP